MFCTYIEEETIRYEDQRSNWLLVYKNYVHVCMIISERERSTFVKYTASWSCWKTSLRRSPCTKMSSTMSYEICISTYFKALLLLVIQ